jgi:hypothetical protein
MKHAMILGYVGAVLGLVGVVATWNLGLGPRWYPIALAGLAIPQCWLGGNCSCRRRARMRIRSGALCRRRGDGAAGVAPAAGRSPRSAPAILTALSHRGQGFVTDATTRAARDASRYDLTLTLIVDPALDRSPSSSAIGPCFFARLAVSGRRLDRA